MNKFKAFFMIQAEVNKSEPLMMIDQCYACAVKSDSGPRF
jgi:hypothetical protein